MENQKMSPFKKLGLSEKMLRAVESAGYEKPSPIQVRAIPVALSGRDIFGCAQTGTGKTAAFALPIMQMLDEKGYYPQAKSFRALILTPTRELAEQIASNISLFGKGMGLSICKAYGGVSLNPQIRMLSGGVDILVATPGRLLDLYAQNKLDFGRVEYLVLDEADRMLDMGFIKDIRKICASLPKKRQSMLFSATLSTEIELLAKNIVHNPEKISVSPDKPTVEKIAQKIAFLSLEDKFALLEEILKERIVKEEDLLTLIFCRTKYGANKLAKRLTRIGLEAEAIHGNKSQSARQNALNRFKNRQTQILVATDIAARGIDVKDMSLVVNYDLPEEAETYVHRIGRTARAEADGEAISFCTADDANLLRAIEKFIKKQIPPMKENPYHNEQAKQTAGSRSVFSESRKEAAKAILEITRGNSANVSGKFTKGGVKRQGKQNRKPFKGKFGERNSSKKSSQERPSKGRKIGGVLKRKMGNAERSPFENKKSGTSFFKALKSKFVGKSKKR